MTEYGTDFAAVVNELDSAIANGASKLKCLAVVNRSLALNRITRDEASLMLETLDSAFRSDEGDNQPTRQQEGSGTDTATDENAKAEVMESPEDAGAWLDLSEDDVTLNYVVDELLPEEHIILFVASGGVGKSMLMFELCASVATGTPFLERRTRRGCCLYVDPELHERLAKRRFRAVCAARGITRDELGARFKYMNFRGHRSTQDAIVNYVLAQARAGNAFDLVVLDSVNAILRGDENSATDMREFICAVQRLAMAAHCAVAIVHHTGKFGGQDAGYKGRGSSVLSKDGPDTVLEITQIHVDEDSDAWETLRAHDRTLSNGETIRATGWRFDCAKLRSGGNPGHIDVVYCYPTHEVVGNDALSECAASGSPEDNGSRGGKESGKLRTAEHKLACMKGAAALIAHMHRHAIGAEGIDGKTACSIVAEALGKDSAQTQKRDVVACIEEGGEFLLLNQISQRRWTVVPQHLPHADDEGEQMQADIT